MLSVCAHASPQRGRKKMADQTIIVREREKPEKEGNLLLPGA